MQYKVGDEITIKADEFLNLPSRKGVITEVWADNYYMADMSDGEKAVILNEKLEIMLSGDYE